MNVTIDLEQPSEHSVIVVRGELDVHHASSLRELLQCLLSAYGHELVVDATGVRVLDAAGRASLDGLARHCREYGGRVRLPGEHAPA